MQAQHRRAGRDQGGLRQLRRRRRHALLLRGGDRSRGHLPQVRLSRGGVGRGAPGHHLPEQLRRSTSRQRHDDQPERRRGEVHDRTEVQALGHHSRHHRLRQRARQVLHRVPDQIRRPGPGTLRRHRRPAGLHRRAHQGEGAQARGDLFRRPDADRRAHPLADGAARHRCGVRRHLGHQVRLLHRRPGQARRGQPVLHRRRAVGKAARRPLLHRQIRAAEVRPGTGGVRPVRVHGGGPDHGRDRAGRPAAQESHRGAAPDPRQGLDRRQDQLRRPRPERRPAHHEVRGAGRQMGGLGRQRVRLRSPQAQVGLSSGGRRPLRAVRRQRPHAWRDLRHGGRRLHAVLRRARRDQVLPRRCPHRGRLCGPCDLWRSASARLCLPRSSTSNHLAGGRGCHSLPRRADREVPGAAAAHRASSEHAAPHADARRGAARVRAPVLPAGREPEAFPAAPAAGRGRARQLHAAPGQRSAAPRRPGGDRGGALRHYAHQARPGDPRGGAGRRDRAHHGNRFRARGAADFRARLGAGRARRNHERPLLQRDQFLDRAAAGGDRILGGGGGRAGQYLRRDPRRLPVRRAADGRRGAPAGAAAAAAFRVQGRFRVRGGDRIHGVAADRPDRREDRGARMSALPGIASIAAMALYAALFLHAESQAQVLGLLALAVVGVPVLARAGWVARTATSLEAHPLAARLASVAALAAIIALFHDQHFVMLMLASVLLYSVACLGLTVQFGYAGVVNFAGAAFLGVGGYTSAVLGPHVPHALVLLIGGLLAALVGSILILPILRTRGHYAALITVAFGILFRTFVEVNDALGGPQGLQVTGMNLFGWELNSPLRDLSFYANYVFVGLALAAAAFVLVRRLERSWVGLNLDAVRLDETASAVFGIDVARWKILAFTFGNFFAGIAGAAYAMMTGFVAPNSFTFGDSLILVSIVLLGGLGSAWGVPLAASIVLIVPEKLQALQEYRFLLYAVLVIAILLVRPQGLIARPPREYFPK